MWHQEERYLWWFYDQGFAQHVPTCAEYGIDMGVVSFEVDVYDWLCMRESLWARRQGLA